MIARPSKFEASLLFLVVSRFHAPGVLRVLSVFVVKMAFGTFITTEQARRTQRMH